MPEHDETPFDGIEDEARVEPIPIDDDGETPEEDGTQSEELSQHEIVTPREAVTGERPDLLAEFEPVDPESGEPAVEDPVAIESIFASSETRRGFVKVSLGAVSLCYMGAFGYPVYRYLATPARRAEELGAVNEVAIPEGDVPPAGSALMFRFGTRPALLIHHADGAFACFDAICTHLGCTVQFQPEESRIYCACHGGVYDMNTGKNVAGPPPKPLQPYRVEATDGQIVVTRA